MFIYTHIFVGISNISNNQAMQRKGLDIEIFFGQKHKRIENNFNKCCSICRDIECVATNNLYIYNIIYEYILLLFLMHQVLLLRSYIRVIRLKDYYLNVCACVIWTRTNNNTYTHTYCFSLSVSLFCSKSINDVGSHKCTQNRTYWCTAHIYTIVWLCLTSRRVQVSTKELCMCVKKNSWLNNP